MEITLVILYYLYLVLLGIFFLFTFFNYYALIRFGFGSWANFAVMIFFALITVLIILISWEYIKQIDWQQPLITLDKNTWANLFEFKLPAGTAPTINTNLVTY
jgi:hypothetical protein